MKKKLLVFGLLIFTLLVAKVTCNAAEMLQTTNFKSGVSLPWNVSESNEMNSYSKIVDGEYMVHIDQNGTNRWDVQIRHREISIISGHSYTIHFKLHALKSQKIYVKVGDQGEPYAEAWSNNYKAFTIPSSGYLDVTKTFTSNINCKSAEFAFHFGGPDSNDRDNDCTAPVPQEIYFTEMSLTDTQFSPTPVPTPTPVRNIRVNELGYFPQAAKKATLVSSSTSPVTVQIKTSSGQVVWTGQSQPRSGTDIASGDKVHIIDFSDFKTVGKGYQLWAGTDNSFPFDIGTDMYSQMKYDALKYFYHARSGIAITMPYCVDSKWARGAGHTNDVASLYPNKPYSDGLYTGGPSTMNFTGGWYDAGDHGKYVVNGGVSTWTLMNEYEHALKANNTKAFDDSTMNIPESGNGKPDLLDESRYNMEYLLKAQIPAGYNKAGMAIHKMADEFWTALGVKPEDDGQTRYFYPPSTAATLNLAATAAQASRLWKTLDSTFSDKCLTAAETAWAAAKKYPDVYAPYVQETGSGAYGDDHVTDDFYWAACELYITTGKSEYYDYMKQSEYFMKVPKTLDGESKGNAGVFDWGNTSALGTIDIALNAPSGMSSSDLSAAKSAVAAAADYFLDVQSKEGYGVPLAVSDYTNTFGGQSEEIKNGYPWGSNSFIVNQAIVMAFAYDYTGNIKYLNGVTESMDYICGRNPMIKCYVSGYGENPLKYPHHRFFCPQIDPDFPSVPPGFLAGGPNSGCQDPWASGSGIKGSPGQKCYLDHVESWSTNEVTINWNAPLAWLTGYLDQVSWNATTPPSPTPTTTISERMRCDINGDGYINMSDVMVLAAAFNTRTGDAKFNVKCDINLDGAVNMSDVMIIAKYFNQSAS